MIPFAQLFWTLSAVGAALFFASGFAAGALRRARAAPVAPETRPPAPSWEAERASLVGERDAAVRRAAELGGELARLEEARRAADAARARREGSERDDAFSAPATRVSAGNDAARATSFQGILDRLVHARGLRSAVLGDALGLPVAALGEHPESLAGFCGFLAQSATRASDYLPLVHLRRIVLEDDRGTTLTACSLIGSELFVATLTTGPGPELPRMVQVLDDASSFLVERSLA